MFKIYCRVFQFVMKYAAYFLPWRKPEILEGENCLMQLPAQIKERGITSVLLVSDKGIMSLGLADKLIDKLRETGIKTVVYDETVPNPTIDNIEAALALYKENACGGIIAVGGGSPMDCAKGVGARVVRKRTKIQSMKGLLKIWRRIPPFFAIPTTSGTGSEATLAAVVVDSKTQEKYALMDPALFPHMAVLDPLLTVKLPPHITSTTGMDALTHAVEAYIGRSNTKETRELSKQTVKLVFENLYTAYIDGMDTKARANMQRAAYYGGIAFTRAYVGNIHAIAHTLGGVYGTPHGLANAVILPHVLDDYGATVFKPLAELADVAGLTVTVSNDERTDINELKAKAFIKAIRDLNAKMNIPTTIDGILEKDIDLMSKRASHEANPTYPVPRIFSHDDFMSVYRRLMGKSGFHGYAGKMARVNLSTEEVSEFMPQKDELAKYVGGKGLAAKIIYDEFDGKVDAFSEENVIVITTSPLTGSTAACSSRFNISAISPLTGILASSNCGGNFGLSLKRAGYDALVISGKSPRKTYLRINEDGITLEDATELWGKSTTETQEMLGKGGKLVIGIAGENLVNYACVTSEERVAGRGGIGAVFGHKLLKGIVANGTKKITIYNQEKFKSFNKKWIDILKRHYMTGERLPKYGTAGLVRMMQHHGLLATKNYTDGKWDKYDNVSGETLREKHLVKNAGCATCPIHCGRVVKLDGKEIKGPELETIGLMGPNLLNDDLELIIKMNHLCDEFGMDTMSFGASVGFAMELSEKGLWDNGLKFGECGNILQLIEQIAKREGIGDDIAGGVKFMSDKYGGADFANHSKGLEFAAYDPHAAQGMGLGYATSNRGGCHLNGGYMVVLEGLGMHVNGKTTRGKAALTIFFQDLMEAASAGGSCLFSTYAVLPTPVVKSYEKTIPRIVYALFPWFGGIVAFAHNHPGILGINVPSLLPHPYVYKLVTGEKINIGRFTRNGERLYNLERLINIRQGLYDGDTLPARITGEGQQSNKDNYVRLDPMLKKYYRIRGWDEHGTPKPKRLRKLGL